MRLTSQFLESLSIPAKKPIMVAAMIPKLETRIVFNSPTTRALPNEDCEEKLIRRWLISKKAWFVKKSKPVVRPAFCRFAIVLALINARKDATDSKTRS
jgi:hypothetical protein